MHELKLAARQLLKSPGFVLVAVFTLALGIGANTAVFSVMDRLLIRPLPVPSAEKLVLLGDKRRDGRVDFEFNHPLFKDFRRENRVFSHLVAIAATPVGLGIGEVTERQQAQLVSGDYFAMLGVGAALGRTFADNEGRETDDAAVVVLSHGAWVRQFAADPAVIGRKVSVNGKPFEVIGVAPREFAGVIRWQSPDLYLPITAIGQISADRPGGVHPLDTRYFVWHQIMGRLKDGIQLEPASAAMAQLSSQIYKTAPPNTPSNLVVLSGASGFGGDLQQTRLPFSLLLATSTLVLLIACGNLAGLQMARVGARSKEFAVRLALGSGRAALIRGLMVESVVLAVAGGALGLLFAGWLSNFLETFRPPNVTLDLGAGIDTRVMVFGFLVSLATALIFGLLPAVRSSRASLVEDLKQGGGVVESHSRRWNLRGLLVAGQVALSVLVLICAGLCVRSLHKLQNLGTAFEPSRVVLASLDLGLSNYSDARAGEFYDQLLLRVRQLPGVEAASLASNTPLSGQSPSMSVERVEGYERRAGEPPPVGEYQHVSNDYFRTLNIGLVRGRDFNATDTAGSAPVVIINVAYARRYLGGLDPVGRILYQHSQGGGKPTEVVGVVQDFQSRSLQSQPRPAMFFPRTQKSSLEMTLVIRTALSPGSTMVAVREVVRSLDSSLPLFGIRTMEQQKEGSLALQRMAALMLAGFGLLALMLAALGIYGVLNYSVGQRTREIGVRMSLGADSSDVIWMVLKQGARLLVTGLLAGIAAGAACARLLGSFLHEVQPLDLPTYGAVISGLLAVAAIACWIPARRASQVAPMEALRGVD